MDVGRVIASNGSFPTHRLRATDPHETVAACLLNACSDANSRHLWRRGGYGNPELPPRYNANCLLIKPVLPAIRPIEQGVESYIPVAVAYPTIQPPAILPVLAP